MGLGLRQNPTSTASITSPTTDTVSSTSTATSATLETSSSPIEAATTSTASTESSTSGSSSLPDSSTSAVTTSSDSSTPALTSTSDSLTSTVTSSSDSFSATSTVTSMSSSQPASSGSSQESNATSSSTSTSISSSTTSDSSTTSSTSGSTSTTSSSTTSTTSTSTTTSSTTTSTTSSSSTSDTTTSTSTSSTSSTSSSSTQTSTTTSDTTTSTTTSSSSAATPTETSSSSSFSPIAAASTTSPPSPTTTFQTTIFVTTTDSSGHTTTSAPTEVTLTSTSTSDGAVVTITAIGANPTLSSSSDSGKNSFLQNTPAVAGVSVLVGLAATSIIIFLAFYIRRRRRRARIEHDTAVSATLAAAGFTRRALDDDLDDAPGSTATGRYRDSDGDPFGGNRSMSHSAGSGGVLEMGQRSSSHLSGRNSAYSANAVNAGNGFNPYTEFGYAVPMGAPSSPTGHPPSSYVPPGATSGPGYIPVANGERGSPVPGHSPGPSIGGSAALGEKGHGHNASAGSYEPLLGTWWASQGQTQSESVTKDEPSAAAEGKPEGSHESQNGAPIPPPRNPRRLIDSPAEPGSSSPLPSGAGHQSTPSEDLLGLGALSGGSWGVQGKTTEANDDASSFHSNLDDAGIGKLLQARSKSRVQKGKARKEGAEDESLFGDHEDYSQRVGGRGVLGVRNATDLDSERSVRSSMDS